MATSIDAAVDRSREALERSLRAWLDARDEDFDPGDILPPPPVTSRRTHVVRT